MHAPVHATQHDLAGRVKPGESFWTLGELIAASPAACMMLTALLSSMTFANDICVPILQRTERSSSSSAKPIRCGCKLPKQASPAEKAVRSAPRSSVPPLGPAESTFAGGDVDIRAVRARY